MTKLAVVAMLLLGFSADVEARGSRGGHASSSHAGSTGTGSSSKSHAVRGYTTKKGTSVAPHRQTDANHTQRDNYGTKGNVNPTTGKVGTKSATH